MPRRAPPHDAGPIAANPIAASRARRAAAALVALGTACALAQAADDGPRQAWRLERWQALPGSAPAGAPPFPAGRRLVLAHDRLSGPAGLDCGAARTAVIAMPTEGLFQGGLPAGAARRLGLGAGPHPTLRIDCDNASLDLHRGPDGLWRLALDGRIAVWRRLGASDAPAVVVQDLLLHHLGRPPAPYDRQVAAVAPWLHPALRRDFAGYFAHPWPKDEVPPLDGDPFTDSQEPPDRIEWLTTGFHGTGARQTLRLVFEAGGQRHERPLHYELRRHGGRWRVVDIVGGDGEGLADLLRRR